MGRATSISGDASDYAALVDGVFLRYTFDPQGIGSLVYISETCVDIWGYTAAEITADESILWRCVDSKTRAQLNASIKLAVDQLTAWRHEWLIRDRGGKAHWLKGVGRPKRNDDGSTSWMVAITDITQSARVDLLNQTTLSNFRMFCDRLEDVAVHRFGADLKITYWNPASAAMYGYTEEEALGRDVVDLVIPEEHRDKWRSSFDEILALKRRSTPFEGWLQRKDRSRVEVKGNVVLLEYPDGPGAFVCMDYDLAPRRRQEEERSSLEAQLRQSQKLEALGTLAGGVAHDFNNILAAILGNTRLALMDADGNAEVVKSLQEIQRAGHRAKDLVQRILSFSRRTVTTRRMLSMEDVISESVELLRATAPKTMTIEVDADPRTPHVLADPSQLHQVFLNLCTNAIQAMHDPDRGQLRIRMFPHPGVPEAQNGSGHLSVITDPLDWPTMNVCVSVEDNGCGMDDQTLARLFEPFFTTKPVGVGTGLGMPVVHGILRDHQGAITVKSQPGAGSVFKVYLRAADSASDANFVDAGIDNESALPRVLLNDVGQWSTILYVDDDEMINDLVERMLKRAGFPVHMYSSSKKALDDVRSGAAGYDLAVVDYQMPGLNGLELAKELRRLHPTKPVAISSGLISEQLRRDATDSGITELIHKPNTGTELLKAISRLARRVAPDLE